MRIPSAGVREPFATDHDFWLSVRASGEALVTILLAAVLTAVLGVWGAVAFVVPAGLLVQAAGAARASSRRSQAAFATREDWREAERHAVAHAFLPALLRREGFSPAQAKNTRS